MKVAAINGNFLPLISGIGVGVDCLALLAGGLGDRDPGPGLLLPRTALLLAGLYHLHILLQVPAQQHLGDLGQLLYRYAGDVAVVPVLPPLTPQQLLGRFQPRAVPVR